MIEAVGRRAVRPARRRLITLGVGVAVAVGLWLALTQGGGAPVTRAPAFSLPRLGGGTPVGLPLTGTEARHPVVLTFFASWCAPCHKDLPVVASVARQAAAAGSRVVFLGIDGNDAPSSGLAFARQSGVAFAVGKDAVSAVAPRFTLDGYPGTVFVDGAGDVVDTVRGPVSRTTLETWLRRLGGAGTT